MCLNFLQSIKVMTNLYRVLAVGSWLTFIFFTIYKGNDKFI